MNHSGPDSRCRTIIFRTTGGERLRSGEFRLSFAPIRSLGKSEPSKSDGFAKMGAWISSDKSKERKHCTSERLTHPVSAQTHERAFLLNELELGLFLARFARDSRLRGRAEWQRQKASAREAYRRVVGFLPAMAATSEQRATIKRRLSRLHSTLRELS